MRTYLIRMAVAFGLAAGLLTTVPQLAESAGAWPVNATTQTAEARCLDGLGNVGVNLYNNEVGPAGDMTIVATDRNSGKSYDFGLVPAHRDGEEYVPPPTGIIYLGVDVVPNGTVDFHRHYVDGHAGDDTVSVAYDGVDCRPAPNGSTSASVECKSDTGDYHMVVLVHNLGLTSFTITSADLPGLTPWQVPSGPDVVVTRELTLPGSTVQSSYRMELVNDADKTSEITGQIMPVLDGKCVKVEIPPPAVCEVPAGAEPGTTVFTGPDGSCIVVPSPTPAACEVPKGAPAGSTAARQPDGTCKVTSPPTYSSPTLPNTGGDVIAVGVAGIGAVGAGSWGCWWGQKRKRKNKS